MRKKIVELEKRLAESGKADPTTEELKKKIADLERELSAERPTVIIDEVSNKRGKKATNPPSPITHGDASSRSASGASVNSNNPDDLLKKIAELEKLRQLDAERIQELLNRPAPAPQLSDDVLLMEANGVIADLEKELQDMGKRPTPSGPPTEQKDLRVAKKKIRDLEDELAEAKDEQRTLDALNKKIQDAEKTLVSQGKKDKVNTAPEKTITKAKNRLRDLERDLSEEDGAPSPRNKEHQEMLRAANDRIKVLEKQIADVVGKEHEPSVDEKQLRQAQRKIKDLETELDTEGDQLRAANKRIKDLENRLVEAGRKEVPNNNDEVQLAAAKKRIRALEDEVADDAASLKSANAKNRELQQKIRDLEKQIQDLESRASKSVPEASREIPTSGGDSKALKDENSKLKKEADDAKQEIDQLKRDIGKLKSELAGAKQEIEQLQSDIAKLKSDKSAIQKEADEATHASERLKSEVAKLNDQLARQKVETKEAEDELRAARQKLKEAESKSEDSDALKAAKQRIQELEKEVLDLQKKGFDNLRAAKAQNEELQTELDRASRKQPQSPTVPESSPSPARPSTDDELKALKEAHNALLRAHDVAKVEAKHADETKQRLEGEVNALKGSTAELAKATRELDIAKIENKRLEELTKAQEEELLNLKKSTTPRDPDADKRLKELEAENKALRERATGLQKEVDIGTVEAKHANEKIKTLEDEHKELRPLKDKVAQLEKELDLVKAEDARLKSQLEAAEAKIAAVSKENGRLEEKCVDADKEIKQKNNQIQSLKDAAAKLDEEIAKKEQEIADLKTAMSKLEEDAKKGRSFDDVQSQIGKLVDEYENALKLSREAVNDKTKTCELLRIDLCRAMNDLCDHEREKAQKAEKAANVGALQAEIDKLKQKLEFVEKQNQELGEEKKSLGEQVATLTRDNVTLKGELEKANHAEQEWHMEAEKLRDKVGDLRDKANANEVEAHRQTALAENAQTQNAKLTQKAQDLQEEADRLRAQIGALEEKVRGLTRENGEKTQRVADLTADLETARGDARKAESHYADLQHAADKAREKLEAAEKENAHLNKELGAAEQKLKDEAEELTKLREQLKNSSADSAQIQALKHEVDALKEKLAATTKELEKTKQDYEAAKKQLEQLDKALVDANSKLERALQTHEAANQDPDTVYNQKLAAQRAEIKELASKLGGLEQEVAVQREEAIKAAKEAVLHHDEPKAITQAPHQQQPEARPASPTQADPRITALEETVKKLETAMQENAKAECERLRTENDALRKELAEKQHALEQLQHVLDEANKEIDRMRASEGTGPAEVHEMDAETLRELREENEVLRRKVDDLEIALEATQRGEQEALSQLHQLEEAMRMQDECIKILEKQQLTQGCLTPRTAGVISNEREELLLTQGELLREVEEGKLIQIGLQEQISDLETALRKSEAELNEVTQLVSEQRAANDELIADNAHLAHEQQSFKARLAELEATVGVLDDVREELRLATIEQDQAHKEIESLTGQNLALREAAEASGAKVDESATAKLRELQKTLKQCGIAHDAKVLIDQQQRSLEDNRAEIDALTATVQEQASQIEQLRSNLANQACEVQGAGSDRVTVTIPADVGADPSNTANTGALIQALLKKNQQLAGAIGKQQAQERRSESQLQQSAAALKKAQNDVKDAQGRIAVLENRLNSSVPKESRHPEYLDVLDTIVNAKNGAIASHERAQALKDEIIENLERRNKSIRSEKLLEGPVDTRSLSPLGTAAPIDSDEDFCATIMLLETKLRAAELYAKELEKRLDGEKVDPVLGVAGPVTTYDSLSGIQKIVALKNDLIDHQQKQLEELKAKEITQSAYINSLRRKLATARKSDPTEELSKVQAMLTASTVDSEGKSQTLAQLHKAQHVLESQQDSKNEAIALLQRQVEDPQEKFSESLDAHVNTLTRDLDWMSRDLRESVARNESSNAVIAELQAAVHLGAVALTESQESQARAEEELKAALNQVHKLSEEKSSCENRIAALESFAAEAQTRASQAQHQVEDLRQQLKSSGDLGLKCESLGRQVETQKKELREATEKCKGLDRSLAQSEEALRTAEEEVSTLKTKLQTAKDLVESRTASLRNTTEELDGCRSELRSALTEKDRLAHENSRLRNDLSATHDRAGKLDELYAESQQACALASKLVDDKNATVSMLRAALAEAEHERDELRDRLLEEQSRCTRATVSLQELERACDALRKNGQARDEILQEVEQEAGRYAKLSQEAEEKLRAKEADVLRLTHQLNAAEAANKDNVARLRSNLQEKDAQWLKSIEDFGKLEGELAASQKALTDAEAKIIVLQDENAELQRNLNNANMELSDAMSRAYTPDVPTVVAADCATLREAIYEMAQENRLDIYPASPGDDVASDPDSHLVSQLRFIFKKFSGAAAVAEAVRQGVMDISSHLEVTVDNVVRDSDLNQIIILILKRVQEWSKEIKGLKSTVETLRRRVIHLSDSNKRLGDELELRMAELDSAQTEELYFLRSRRDGLVRNIWSLYQNVRSTQHTASECYAHINNTAVLDEELSKVVENLNTLQSKAHFVIANFFTEAEKMDLGTGDVVFRASEDRHQSLSESGHADIEESAHEDKPKKEKKKRRSSKGDKDKPDVEIK